MRIGDIGLGKDSTGLGFRLLLWQAKLGLIDISDGKGRLFHQKKLLCDITDLRQGNYLILNS